MKDKRMTIDALKGIAILGVVLVHYGSNLPYDTINLIVANGARGVQLLFVINGYLIFWSLDKIELTKKNVINWWKNKFLRIIPLYWFFTILHLFVFGLGSRYYLGPHENVSGVNIFCNLFFLHNFYPYFNCINANWFMGIIAIFYIVAPLLKKIINSLEKAVGMLIVILPMGYLLMHSLLINYSGNYPKIWADYVRILSFPSEFPCICVGIIIYYLEKMGVLITIKNKSLFSLALLLIAGWGMVSLIYNKNFFVIGNNISTFGVVFGIVLISQLINPLYVICNKFFAGIGKHSYGIYLSHIFILEFMQVFIDFNKDNCIKWFFGYILVVAVALVVTMLAEKVFEQNRLVYYLQKIEN